MTATLDATGVKTDSADRDVALRSADFFDVAKYPKWIFSSTKIVSHEAAAFELDGTLTLHGVTQPERLEVAISGTPSDLPRDGAGRPARVRYGDYSTRPRDRYGRQRDALRSFETAYLKTCVWARPFRMNWIASAARMIPKSRVTTLIPVWPIFLAISVAARMHAHVATSATA